MSVIDPPLSDESPERAPDDPSPGALLAAGDIVGLMRACHERRLEREGIPMVLGLTDERGRIPANRSADQVEEGARFADVFDR